MHVAYKGAAPALQDVIAGHVQMMFATAASVVGHIQDGQVRPLAVTTLKRTAILPDIPTIDELGTQGFRRHHLARPGRAGRHADGHHRGAARAPSRRWTIRRRASRSADLGVDIVGDTPEEFAAYIKAEIPKWTAIVKASGAAMDQLNDRIEQTPRALAHKVRRLGHLDLPGAGQVTVAGHHAYVGHIPNKEHLGTSIVDIADPRNPRVVATVTLDDPTSHSHKVRVVGDVMIVNHERNMTHDRPARRAAAGAPGASWPQRSAASRRAPNCRAKLNVSEADIVEIEAARAARLSQRRLQGLRRVRPGEAEADRLS